MIAKILNISTPRNVRGKTSEGAWAVDFEVESTLGNTGKQKRTKYFWRKKDALEWIEMFTRQMAEKENEEEMGYYEQQRLNDGACII